MSRTLLIASLAATAILLVRAPAQAASFFEPFTWKGNHAATIRDGAATTVWWNEDNWDVRGSTAFLAVTAQSEGDPPDPPPAHGFFYHTDIHKAASADPRDGREANDSYVVGGDGSPGLGAMRLDYQSVVSARLRNPMTIGAGAPGVVTFYAPKFVTTGHWWEVSITPASGPVTSGEHTSIPSVNQAFEDPYGAANNDNRTAGPGILPALDSINVILTGYPDRPTCDGSSWRVRFGVRRSVGGVSKDYLHFITSLADLPPTDPLEKDELYQWQIRFFPGKVVFLGDLDKNGTLEILGSYSLSIPWTDVYVNLLGVAYQAGHHPDRNCGWQGQVREDLVWRNVSVSPVKYAKTEAFPKVSTPALSPAWMAYDTRDLQRFGPPIMGQRQPNAAQYGGGDPHGTSRYCAGETVYCANDLKGKAVGIGTSIPVGSLANLARAQFVYDIRGDQAPGAPSSRVRLSVNGHIVGVLPPGSRIIQGVDESAFVERSIDIPAADLVAGTNVFRLYFFNEAGSVYLDRMRVELDAAQP